MIAYTVIIRKQWRIPSLMNNAHQATHRDNTHHNMLHTNADHRCYYMLVCVYCEYSVWRCVLRVGVWCHGVCVGVCMLWCIAWCCCALPPVVFCWHVLLCSMCVHVRMWVYLCVCYVALLYGDTCWCMDVCVRGWLCVCWHVSLLVIALCCPVFRYDITFRAILCCGLLHYDGMLRCLCLCRDMCYCIVPCVEWCACNVSWVDGWTRVLLCDIMWCCMLPYVAMSWYWVTCCFLYQYVMLCVACCSLL